MEVNACENIEELRPSGDPPPNPDPNPNPEPRRRIVRTKVPEVEIHLFNRGKGPIATFSTSLGGWDQDRLDVQDILEKYGFQTLYSFNSSGRGVPIRFNRKNGRSILSYTDGSLVLVDGEPKDPLVKPITKFLVGVVLISIVISVLMKDPPDWLKNLKLSTGVFPAWVLACAVVVLVRFMKRTKGLLKFVS
ncbi:hypothetical protein KFK09_022669 [Dendrobium nobile]|uniref:Uncharacterized protein n=1 Tax=Dendrobium nobile TaxID=94219 RepID=A0A8T3AJC7_DENNO|nr:hypothetical protein KFK09_022669 [Dendrobium nobile]